MERGYSVFIVGAAILLVPESEDFGGYDDVVNSILLAQLVANKQAEKTPDINWYDVYTQVLDDFWLRYIKAQEDRYLAPGSDSSVIQALAAVMSRMDVEQGQRTAAVLSRLAGVSPVHPAIDLLRTHMQKPSTAQSSQGSKLHLLVMVADTPASFSSVYLSLETEQVLSPNPLTLLHQAENGQGVLTLRYAQANLSEVLYGLARETVSGKVKDKIATNVALLMLDDKQLSVAPPRETGA
ncbi:hypothetical protein NZ35_08480 [Pseudomonas chlororaphis]|uniref:Uncharacterized protein n=1 Tax=Pseudomonas chlororaphis TaxID=587753 RepID=A0A0A6DG11_9PSED|nr:hypothetical protein NZ35_08480 [Pseudomonas chlororaphis]